MSDNFYCNFNATGDPIDLERLKKSLDKLWCRAEIKDSSSIAVSASTTECGLLADGWDAVEVMVEQFPALSFDGTLSTTRHREYLWSFEGRHLLIGGIVGAYLRLGFGDLLVVRGLPCRGGSDPQKGGRLQRYVGGTNRGDRGAD